MKKLSVIAFTIFVCFVMQAQQAVLTSKPSKIEAGKELQFSYSGKLAKEGTNIFVLLFGMKGFHGQLLETKLINGKMIGKLQVPDSVVYLNLSITNGKELDDNNKLGYDFNVYKKGKPVKGTYLKQGQFISSGYYRIKEYRFGVEADLEKAVALMEKEYSLYPDLKTETYPNYLRALGHIESRMAEAKILAQKAFDETMLSGVDDNNLQIYTRIIYPEDYMKRDSLEKLIVKRFPLGKVNFSRKLMELIYTQDLNKVFLLNDTLQQQYPQNYKQAENEITKALIVAYRKKLDHANFNRLLSTQKSLDFLAFHYNQIAWEMTLADKDLLLAKTYSEKSLATMDSLKTGKKPNSNSQPEWSETLEASTGNYMDTYALILYKLGDKKEALKLQLKAVEMNKAQQTDVNERLVQFLVEDNQMKEAIARAEEFIIAEKSTAKIDTLYKVAYIALNGSDKGLKETKAKMAARMKDAPDFTLKTLDGKTVKLSDLRGKIVILDFWATWCGPCVASFPGMQKAVNALKDDKDVCFYFINTSERTSDEKRIESIKKTMEKKNVNLEVLLDEKQDEKYVVAELYNVRGIPTKIIIDKNGKIRSTKSGFNGNEVELVNDLKAIVESLK